MTALIRTIVCYLCAIICACSLAFAKNGETFTATGAKLVQSLKLKFLYTSLGTFYVETDEDLPFLAFNPEKLPENANQIFFGIDKGVYSYLSLGKTKYDLSDLVFIKLGLTTVKIYKSLLIFKLQDGSLAIMTNGKFIAHVTNKALADLFFNSQDLKSYGFYEIKDEKVSFQGNNLSEKDKLGTGTKSLEVASDCVNKLFITKEDVAKIKESAPKDAKKTLELVMQEQQNIIYSLEAVLWIAPFVGLDTASMALLEVKVGEKQCEIIRTPLS
jgi:hypothetical protein